MLRLRNVYPGSRIQIFSIQDPGSASMNLIILNQKSNFSRKYDPRCSSRIRILIFTHPGSRIQGSTKHRIPDPEHCLNITNTSSADSGQRLARAASSNLWSFFCMRRARIDAIVSRLRNLANLEYIALKF